MIETVKSLVRENPKRAALLIILLITVLRVIALFTSNLSLTADEAQYWYWGQELAWGYYSKPPMIAWLIAVTTSLSIPTPICRAGS